MRRSKWILLALTPFLVYGVARFCHVQTAGFKVAKIRPNCPRVHPSVAAPMTEDLMEILNHPFTYLGRGKQSFAFLSEDQTTVLKLFNNRYQRKIFWFSLLPFSKDKVTYLQSKLELLSQSYELSFSELQSQTALLYLHLSPTKEIQKTVTLIDKLGISHRIPLDTTGFALQKRGTPAYAHLSRLMQEGKQEEALQALRLILTLITERCKRGIADNDPLIRTNLGFLDSRPFYIDIGPFSANSRETEKETYIPEVNKITTSLRHWLEMHHPALVTPFEEMVTIETTPY